MTLRAELLEEHWSYMDGFGADMVARGPTLSSDGETATGSVHILDLPDAAVARAFAFDEPNYQGGVYRDVLLRRWRNLLGRTMWDFPGGESGGNRYLVLGLGTGDAADLSVPPNREELIAYGIASGRRWQHLARHCGAAGRGRRRRGAGGLDHGPVRKHRGSPLAVRRAAVLKRRT